MAGTHFSIPPIGSCKEQASGNVYGAAPAEAGFVVIAFDRSYQGASGGKPRFIEDPVQAVDRSSCSPVFWSSTVLRLRHLATVLGLTPSSRPEIWAKVGDA
ncbi:hypothetical protein [Paracoccus halophilus]|uniref:hypothetical protein n=1 Tax=Paracoccus halophilus TaxID=376733 RepID=UPI000A521384|nr:hypothetical protein [Paracoccus halophilus]